MKHLDLKPNIRTYEILFSLFGNVNVPYEEGNMLSHADMSKRISIIEMDMLNHEIQHSFVSMKNLVCLPYTISYICRSSSIFFVGVSLVIFLQKTHIFLCRRTHSSWLFWQQFFLICSLLYGQWETVSLIFLFPFSYENFSISRVGTWC
jgi:hypothetical protein